MPKMLMHSRLLHCMDLYWGERVGNVLGWGEGEYITIILYISLNSLLLS